MSKYRPSKTARAQAAEMRKAIIEGYHDLIAGRFIEFKGDLRAVLKELARREKRGWK